MSKNNLPNNIAIFPLSNAIFFPKTILPLNIFEERYIQLVDNCMKGKRMFGMVQPKTKAGKTPKVYDIGCHKIFKENIELPNTDWVNKNHWCVPIYYKGEN